jgi:Gas vesicle synthesis protein GvpL/GvpF
MPGSRRMLHAITRANTPVVEPHVERIQVNSLQAVCSSLGIQADHADAEWLAAAAQRHHAIIQQLFERGPVLPVRFGTLIEADAIRSFVQRETASIEAEINRLEGLEEWGAKLIADPAHIVRLAEQSSEAVRQVDADLAASTPGKAYLLRRRREALVADAAERQTCTIVDEIHRKLDDIAVEAAALPVPAAAEAAQDVLANLAFLVPAAGSDRFAAAADEAAKQTGISIELSGPWPPYSFARLNVGGDGA